ncbi:hypothetical protein AB4161_22990 [Vibrio sp. 10N.286.51.E5]|uniref:hypothetical protein n=1 Tax=Vibrio sp. 10N.286.51.E5 TaxID=3229709 RepID=UPI003551F10C
MKWPKILVRKMTIKTKVRGTKKPLKTKIQKKRILKRNPSISLDKRDYSLNSLAQSVSHFIRTRTMAETTLLAMKSHARHVIRHIGDIDISKPTKQRIEEFKMDMMLLFKVAKTEEQRETIFAVIDMTIAEGGYQ